METIRDTLQNGNHMRHCLGDQEDVFIKYLPSELRESYRRGGGIRVGARGDGGDQKHKALWINRANLTWTYKDWSGKHWAYTGLRHVLGVYVIAFSLVLLWNSWVYDWVGVSFVCLLLGFFPFVGLPCPTLMWWFLFILLYFIFFLKKHHWKRLADRQTNKNKTTALAIKPKTSSGYG